MSTFRFQLSHIVFLTLKFGHWLLWCDGSNEGRRVFIKCHPSGPSDYYFIHSVLTTRQAWCYEYPNYCFSSNEDRSILGVNLLVPAINHSVLNTIVRSLIFMMWRVFKLLPSSNEYRRILGVNFLPNTSQVLIVMMLWVSKLLSCSNEDRKLLGVNLQAPSIPRSRQHLNLQFLDLKTVCIHKMSK